MVPSSPKDRPADDGIIEYWAGNPGVEIFHGHIMTAGRETRPGARKPAAASSGPVPRGEDSCAALASKVPCYMSAPEFCDFVGAFAQETHRRFRHCTVLHGRNTEEYLIAILLDSAKSVNELLERFDRRRFNDIEENECRLQRIVGCLRTNAAEEGHLFCPTAVRPGPRPSGPGGTGDQDPRWSPQATRSPGLAALSRVQTSPPVTMSPVMLPGSPAAGPASGPEAVSERPLEDLFCSFAVGATGAGASATEKAFCAVCLEQIESAPANYQLTEVGGGVPLTILCGHTFHARCLSRWCDATCPVCRFQQHPYQTSCCDVCGQADGLHICLVCGLIGCTAAEGEGHAQQHFEATSHAYAVEVSTQRVWDYAGNGYVHRLLYNDQDGKLVEHTVPQTGGVGGSPAGGQEQAAAAPEGSAEGVAAAAAAEELLGLARTGGQGAGQGKKQEAVVSEFNALLSSQMTAQRKYYEERTQELEQQHGKRLDELVEKKQEQTALAEDARRRMEELGAQITEIESTIAATNAEEEVLRRQKKQLEVLNERISGEQKAFEDKADGERERKKAAKQRRDSEVADLQQQVKDLELYIQMRRRCEASGDAAELQGSHMVITETDQRGRGGRKPRKR